MSLIFAARVSFKTSALFRYSAFISVAKRTSHDSNSELRHFFFGSPSLLLKQMHIAESPPEPSALVANDDAIIAQLVANNVQLGEDVTLVDVRQAIRHFDVENKGGLWERQWRTLCAERSHLFASSTKKTMRLVDFGRVAEVDVGGGAPSISISEQGGVSLAATFIRMVEGFIAGGIAGAVSKTVIAPGDRVKIIFQVDPSKVFSFRAAISEAAGIVRRGGVLCLWLGNGATMMRVVPYASITFMSFEQYHKVLRTALVGSHAPSSTDDQKRAVAARFFSGALAGATSTACTYPLDLMRARFAATKGTEHASYVTAFQTAMRTEGFRGLYSGLRPTLIGIMPYAGSSFACFETVKHYLVHWQALASDKDIPAYQRLMAGGFSGLVAQSLTYPLDIVRRRMQVTPEKYTSIRHALSEIYRAEGLRRGLYKGLTMNWIKGPIAVATSFTINDVVKTRIRAYHSATESRQQSHNRRRGLTFVEMFCCGAFSGFIAKLWTLPFERMKLLFLSHPEERFDLFNSTSITRLKQTYFATKNPWQGSGAMMIRVVPYAALTYSCFERWQPVAERVLFVHDPSFSSNFVAGALAASVSTFVLHPLDLMRYRQAISENVKYMSYYLGMKEMVRSGGWRSLWAGAGASILGVFPMAGIGFAVYEDFKTRFAPESFAHRLALGAAAGCLAQAATYPLNVARRQRQQEMSINVIEAVRQAVASRGYAALYQRMPFGRTLGAVTVGISFSVFDATCDVVYQARCELLKHDVANYFSLAVK